MAYVQHFNKKGTGKGTVSKYIRSIKHYFNYLIKEEITESNPALNIQIKGIKRKMVYDILKSIELEAIYHKFISTEEEVSIKTQRLKPLSYQMQKVMLGLLIYQGVRSKELINLKPEDVKLREGMIYIPGGRRSNERELKLEAVQILEMQEYLTKTRAEILQITNKESTQLFISSGTSNNLYNTINKFTQTIKSQTGRIQDLQQIRASVIVKWLNHYNLREVQHMAGHRFVSSTERYKQSDLEDLKEAINKFHPTN
jgi:integrase/recombinase XerD